MKALFTTFLVVSFVGIAVFGALAMNHGAGHEAFGCIAAAANAVDCPEGANLFSLATFHFDAFKNFSNAIFGENVLNLLLLALALVFVLAVTVFSSFFITPQPLRRLERTLGFFPQKQELIHWLSLHENSPTV